MFTMLFLSMLFLTAGCVSLADGLLSGCSSRTERRRCINLTLFACGVIFLLLFPLLQILFP